MTEEMPEVPTATAVRRRGSCGCAFGLCLVLPVLAAGFVLGQARGEYHVDAFAPAFFAFVAWCAVPLVLLVGFTKWSWGRYVPGAVAVAALVFTLWLVRPQAPDGRGYPVRLEAGSAALVRDVKAALDRVGVRWTVRFSDTEECRDLFGRSRGASSRATTLDLDRDLTAAEYEQVLAAAASTPEHPFTKNAYGLPVTGNQLGRDFVALVTPCLRPG